MKPKVSLKPGRPVLELGAPNVRDEVSAVAAEAVSKNVAGLPPPLFGPNKILIPVDFSNLSEKLLRYAVQFAQPKGGRIILLHVIEPRPRRERQARFGRTNGNRMDDAERKLLTLGEHEFGSTVTFDVLVQSGRLYREVVNAAKALSVDLIVMGTGGSRKKYSSTAERVVRYAPCPVLVVHEKEHNLFWVIRNRQHRQHSHNAYA